MSALSVTIEHHPRSSSHFNMARKRNKSILGVWKTEEIKDVWGGNEDVQGKNEEI